MIVQWVWFTLWMYLVGLLLTLAVYAAAWARADPPATRHEAAMTLVLVALWPALIVWATLTILEEWSWRR